jgi:DNA-directed RNA polymerase specialized sigma24 family protein
MLSAVPRVTPGVVRPARARSKLSSVSPALAPRRTFPPTRHSIVLGLSSGDEPRRRAAAEVLVRAYWAPVAALLQFRWNLERPDAEDLTQEFFASAIAKEWFAKYDPALGRFRTFLRTCVDRFAGGAAKAQSRLKRGGGIPNEPLEAADAALAHAPDEFDARIHAEWVRGVLALALETFQQEAEGAGKGTQFAVFRAYDVDDPPDDRRPSYRDLAIRFDVSETQVTNYLNWSRREFRRHVLDALRALSGNDAEFREDARDLLGARPL